MNSDLQTLIASVGFPIALSMYLLVRIEGKLQILSDSINELSKNIFAPNGADIVQTVEAKVVVTDTTPYDLEL